MGSINVIRASAGSGKTYRLAYEYVRTVIAAPSSYRHILAVTFTNKATDEMKQRIIREINLLAGGAQSNYLEDLKKELGLTPEVIRIRAAEARTKILHDYSHFAVLTIDKFFQKIIRAFIRELHIDVNFSIELQTDTLLSAATDRMIDSISSDDRLRLWIERFIEEKIDKGSRWDVKGELEELGRELFKESYKSITPSDITLKETAETIQAATKKVAKINADISSAAQEMLSIITEAGLSTADFAYGRSGFMSYVDKCASGEIAPYGGRVKDALSDDGKWCSRTSRLTGEIQALIPRLRPLLEKITSTYDSGKVLINSTALLREKYMSFILLGDIKRNLDEVCAEGGVLPISETNGILRKLVEGNDAPFIFEKAGNHYSHYMIDEFQDTSRVQWNNFRPLLDNALSQYSDREQPVLLVGDVKQAIYRWRGGDWQIMGRDVREQFRSVAESSLGVNYRSARNIVEFNNGIMAKVVGNCNDSLNNSLSTAVEEGNLSRETASGLKDAVTNAYVGHAQKFKSEAREGYIHITEYQKSRDDDSGPSEQERLISAIDDLQSRGFRPRDIAILVRSNKEGGDVADMLLDHKSHNPHSKYKYDLVTQEALLICNSPCVGFIIACLYISGGSGQSIKQALYNQWLGRSVDAPLPQEEQDLLSSLRLMSLEEALEAVLLRYKLSSRREDVAYIQALHELVITFSSTKVSDIPLFLKWWEETGITKSISMPDGQEAITISSIHKAKGLEYKAVILPYCNWSLSPKANSTVWARCDGEFEKLGYMPVSYKNSMAESVFAPDYYREKVLTAVDNLNTLYVALTRAEKELHIMIPRRGRNDSDNVGSLLLDGIASDGDVAILRGAEDGDDMRGERRPGSGQTEYFFGSPAAMHDGTGKPAEEIISYPSFPIGQRIRLRFRSERYFSDDDTVKLSPRSYGMMMHRVFENITAIEEIGPQLEKMKNNGEVSEEEAASLQKRIGEAMDDPRVRSWFDPSWTEVRNESSIVIPRTSSPKRPDRVMTRGDQAVVVDYKFGAKENKAYNRQIAEYMSLLKDMGYKQVDGYIWYVEQNRIEEITSAPQAV